MNPRFASAVLSLACFLTPTADTFAAGAGDKSQQVDARYTPEALKRAFAELCTRLNYRAIHVNVDQSEYPYIVYGTLEGRCDYKDIRDALQTMPGYAYSGSVVATNRDGSRTVFAVNMVPRQERPDMQREMERLKQLAQSER